MNTPAPPPPERPAPAGPLDRDWQRHEAPLPAEGQAEPRDESAIESLGRAVVEPVVGTPAPPPAAPAEPPSPPSPPPPSPPPGPAAGP